MFECDRLRSSMPDHRSQDKPLGTHPVRGVLDLRWYAEVMGAAGVLENMADPAAWASVKEQLGEKPLPQTKPMLTAGVWTTRKEEAKMVDEESSGHAVHRFLRMGETPCG